MYCQDSSKQEKLKSYKIRGRQRPFIDDNLQLQYYDEKPVQEKKSSSPIYFHYFGKFTSPRDEKTVELSQLYDEAAASYRAWKRLTDKINKNYFTRT